MIIGLYKTVKITPKGCHFLEVSCHPFGIENCVTSVNEKERKKSIPDKHLEFRVQKPLPQISLIGANCPKIISENPCNTALPKEHRDDVARGAVLAAKNDETRGVKKKTDSPIGSFAGESVCHIPEQFTLWN